MEKKLNKFEALSGVEKRQYEYRKNTIKAEYRNEDNNGKKEMVLRGYAILFNEPTKIRTVWGDEITEIILPTALDRTDLSNVHILADHNSSLIINKMNSFVEMKLSVDNVGLFFETKIASTLQTAREWYNYVQLGIVDSMSFGFRTGDEINWETMTRTITDIAELFEISLVAFPAYKLASVVAKQDDADKDIMQPDSDGKKTDEQVDTDKEEVKKADSELEKKLKKLEEM